MAGAIATDELMCEFCGVHLATGEVVCAGMVMQVCARITCQDKADDECADVIIGTDYEERV